MCRSIQPLFNFEPPATEGEIHAAAVQFVRKISGFTYEQRGLKFLDAWQALAFATPGLGEW